MHREAEPASRTLFYRISPLIILAGGICTGLALATLLARGAEASTLALLAGLTATALLGIALWFWQAALQRARESEAASASLRDREARLAAIVDTAVEGIIIIDERGIVESINPAAEKIFGHTASEVSGCNVSMLMPEPFRSEHDSYLQRYLGGAPARIVGIGREVTGLRKNGETFPMDLAVSEMRVNGKRMFTGLVRDISERKQMEKMKAEFVSVVSHELRTPLTSITGALGLAASGTLGKLPPEAGQMVEIALKNSQRLAHLINDLLDMEKMAAGKMQFDLQRQPLLPLVKEALAGIRAFADSHQVQLELSEPTDELQVRVDGNRLQQILNNFLSNAIKFTPAGGTVGVSVRLNGDLARIEVCDHGPGIPEAFRSRIFEKFSQADSSDKRKTGGSGLGLAISRELAERMGGKVGFVSEPGQGASFFVEFQAMATIDSAPLASPANTPRLLVVEDDPDVAKLLSIMLQRAGYLVDIAPDGGSALTHLGQHHYDAMTLDLVLPGQCGPELIRHLRSQAATRGIPIIVISGQGRDGKLAIGGEFADIGWLDKPVDEERLLDCVQAALRPGTTGTAQVLYVEDNEDLFRTVSTLCSEIAHFESAYTLAEAREKLARKRYDLIVLDITLPDGNGWELLPQLRAVRPQPPVIVLSATELSAVQKAEVQAALVKTRSSNEEFLQKLEQQLNPLQQAGRKTWA